MKLKVRRHQLDPMKKEINDVVSSVEVNPRTGNIESNHQGYKTWPAGSREKGEEGIRG
jgi:hypothetical protein